MVLWYIIGLGILGSFYEIKPTLDTLLTNIANTKTVNPVEPVLEPENLAPFKPIEQEPLPEPPVSQLPQLPPSPIVSEEPKLPDPKPGTVTLKPNLPDAEPQIISPKAKPIQVPAAPILPKLPMPEPVIQPFAKPMITTAQPVIEQPEVQETAQVTSEGLDTLNVDTSGNWLEKRKWYQAAEQEYEDIHKLIQKTVDIRMKFVSEVSLIGKHIDDFYEKVSFEKGQIDELLQASLGSLTTEQKVRGGDLSSGERSIKEKIHADQASFQSIEATIKSISELDEQVSKTMIKAFQEIDACNALEAKAWNNFKEIGMVLDDKKARVLYFEIKNFYENIEKKIDYLQSNLLTYLQNQLSSKIRQQTNQIQATVNSLKAKGLNLETLLQKDSAGDFVIFKEREEQQAKEEAAKLAQNQAQAKEAQKVVKQKPEKSSWYQNLWCTILNYLCPIITKLSEWAAILWCCIQTLLCKIQEMICKLLGY
jgi:L-fucose mutarotase/ribose pyranase (RbsD/FucU family)